MGICAKEFSAISASSLTDPKSNVTWRAYDVQGRLIRTLIDQDAAAGDFRATWDGKTDSGEAVGNGVYMARLTSDGATVDSRKVVIR